MTEKWFISDRCFTDSWPRKWVIIHNSSSDTIIQQNYQWFFSYSSVISNPSESIYRSQSVNSERKVSLTYLGVASINERIIINWKNEKEKNKKRMVNLLKRSRAEKREIVVTRSRSKSCLGAWRALPTISTHAQVHRFQVRKQYTSPAYSIHTASRFIRVYTLSTQRESKECRRVFLG